MGFIKKPIKGIIKGIKKAIKSITSFVGDAFGFIIKPFGNFETPDVSADQLAQGVKITKSGTNIALPVVYGYRRVGGTIIHVETNGSSNQFLYVVYAICEGEIRGVGSIKLDENQLLPQAPNNVYAPGTVYTSSTGRYKGRVQFQIFNGSENQSRSSLADGSASWSGRQRTLPGVAYAAFRFEWKNSTQAEIDSNPFGGGVPQIQFDVYGKEVYDVATHTTGSDLANDYADLSKSYYQSSENIPGTNPANILLDFLMNPRYGVGLKKEQIDAESFGIAARKYNQIVQYDDNYAGQVLTCNIVINPEQKLIDNTKILVGGCRGIMPYVDGRYKLKVEDGGNATDITSSTVTVAFDVDNYYITGAISLGGEAKTTKYNNVYVNYIDPDRDFSSQQVVYSEAGDKAIDDDEDLTGEFTFNTITNVAIAKEMARMIYLKSRNQRTIAFTGTQEMLKIEPGDIIRITEPILNLTLQTFRVVDIKLGQTGLVDITAIEHDATDYPHVQGEQIEVPPRVYLPDEYSGKPLQRPIADPPVGIIPPPPGNPEDSAGEIPAPTPPPPYEPIDKPTIDAFYYSSVTVTVDPTNLYGRNSGTYHGIEQEYPPTFPILDYDTTRTGAASHGPYSKLFNNTVTLAQPNVRPLTIYNLDDVQAGSYTLATRCLMFINFPQESSIEKILVEAYDGDNRISTSYNETYGYPQSHILGSPYEIQNVPIGASLNPSETRYARFSDKGENGTLILPLNKNFTFKIRAIKHIQGEMQEYRIGGDFTRIGWNDEQQYILKGVRLKDNGLEGFINYINQTYGYAGAGQQNLGG